MNKQLPDNGAIEALNASILTSWTVILAHELGVFRLLLKEPRTREQLSSSLGIADRSLFPLLAVCCALGFVTFSKGNYSPSRLTRSFLDPASPYYAGPYLELIAEAESDYSLSGLRNAIVSGRPCVLGERDLYQRFRNDMDFVERFTRCMHAQSAAPAIGWVSKVDLARYTHFLDIAGGSGIHSVAALRRWPGLTATLFELPLVCSAAEQLLAGERLPKKVQMVSGDMWADPYPPADVHFYSQVFHNWPIEKLEFLTDKSYHSLQRGGVIIVHEVFLNALGTGPLSAAAMAMSMILWTAGQQLSVRELKKILSRAGFSHITHKRTYGAWGVVSAKKS